MADGRRRLAWEHTSQLSAMLANLPFLVWGKEPIYEAWSFNPYDPRSREKPTLEKLGPKESMAFLKRMYGVSGGN